MRDSLCFVLPGTISRYRSGPDTAPVCRHPETRCWMISVWITCWNPSSELFAIYIQWGTYQVHFVFFPILCFFSIFIDWNFVSFTFYDVFHTGFRQEVVFAHIYMFLVDIVLTEFSKQHITWCTEVIWKLLGSVFWGKKFPQNRISVKYWSIPWCFILNNRFGCYWPIVQFYDHIWPQITSSNLLNSNSSTCKVRNL